MGLTGFNLRRRQDAKKALQEQKGAAKSPVPEAKKEVFADAKAEAAVEKKEQKAKK